MKLKILSALAIGTMMMGTAYADIIKINGGTGNNSTTIMIDSRTGSGTAVGVHSGNRYNAAFKVDPAYLSTIYNKQTNSLKVGSKINISHVTGQYDHSTAGALTPNAIHHQQQLQIHGPNSVIFWSYWGNASVSRIIGDIPTHGVFPQYVQPQGGNPNTTTGGAAGGNNGGAGGNDVAGGNNGGAGGAIGGAGGGTPVPAPGALGLFLLGGLGLAGSRLMVRRK